MNKQFDELVQQYNQARKEADVQKQDTILSEMRQNIQTRTSCENYKIEIENDTIILADASFEELLRIDGDINRKTSSDSMTDFSDYSRQTHQENNQYGPNNPYPSQD